MSQIDKYLLIPRSFSHRKFDQQTLPRLICLPLIVVVVVVDSVARCGGRRRRRRKPLLTRATF